MITSYSALQTEIANWLNRGDMASVIPTLIQLAEARLNKDPRVRDLSCRGTFTITEDGDALPDDFRELEAWYHDGPVYRTPIDILPLDELTLVKADYRATGVPRYAGIADGRLYYAPEPDTSYTTRMAYWRNITPLSDANTTNWFLEDHPDLYLYAALAEAAPFLKDDGRVALWEASLEKRLEDLHTTNWQAHWTGRMAVRRRPIG